MSAAGKKTLVLIRHAKSDWTELGGRDVDRSLALRGEHDAPMMGEQLRQRFETSDLKLDAFLCSHAKRAVQTATRLAEALAFPETDIDWRKELYLASPTTMLDTILATPDSASTIILLAHNPGISELAEQLTGCSFGNIPTCGIITLQWPVQHWTALSGRARLLHFDYPKAQL